MLHDRHTHQTLSEEQFYLLKVIEQEYKSGMLMLNSLDVRNTVTFYGGAMVEKNTTTFHTVEKISKLLAEKNWGVVSGGGPGVMTAALRGAQSVGGRAVAFCIDIADEPRPEELQPHNYLVFSQFSVRKFLLRQSDAFIFAPGGIGTLDEMMELLTLIKTGKYPKKTIILLDSEFWRGYLNWFEKILLNERQVIKADVLSLFEIIDTPQEAINVLLK